MVGEMITAWYWHLLLVWVGWMGGVDGKAMPRRSDPNPDGHFPNRFSPVLLQLGVNGTVNFTATDRTVLDNWSLILLRYEGDDDTSEAPSWTKVTDVLTGKLNTKKKRYISCQSHNL